MPDKLTCAVEALRSDIIDTLSNWIRVPSVKAPPTDGAPFGGVLRDMLTLALDDARRLGFSVKDYDGFVGEAEMGEGEETMGILAHLDIVPAGDGWTRDPFGAEIAGGKLYGRGTSDDKGPAVVAMYAMKAVLDAGYTLKKKVRLILGCDEESGWDDIRHYKQHAKMPDFGFSPDGVFPVINTEKGILQLSIDATFPGEEGTGIPVYRVSSGERPNVIPGLATAEIGFADIDKLRVLLLETDLDVTCEALENGHVLLTSRGIAGHASMPENCKNAAGQLLLALSALGAGGGAKAFIDCLASGIGLDYTGEGLGVLGQDAISGPLTLNLGVLSIEGGKGHALIDIRHPVLMSAEMIQKIIQIRVGEAGAVVTVAQAKAPLHVPKESFIVRSLLEVYHDVTGLEPYAIAIGGGTYSRAMENCVAFGINFPGEPELAHQADENIDIENLMLTARVFASAIVRLCC